MELRLSASSLDFYVDVRLRNFDGRWLAVADIAGETEMDLGRTALDALVASLASPAVEAVIQLLSDPGLFGASRQLQ